MIKVCKDVLETGHKCLKLKVWNFKDEFLGNAWNHFEDNKTKNINDLDGNKFCIR